MDEFFTPARQWPTDNPADPGRPVTRIHLYGLPAPDGPVSMAANAAAAALRNEPAVAVMAPRWRHMTIASATGPTRVPWTEVVAAVTAALRDVPPFTLYTGGADVRHASVELQFTPISAADAVACRNLCLAAATGLWNATGQARPADPDRPHMAIAYGAGRDDSTAIARRMGDAAQIAATWRVSDVHVVDAIQRPRTRDYRWHRSTRIPLTGAVTRT